MIPRPPKFPEWASVAQDDPYSPTPAPNILEPTDAQKQLGWFFKQPPPANVMNWWQNLTCQWIKYIDQQSSATGKIDFSFDMTPRAGWILVTNSTQTTIGNAASGATIRANSDTRALFNLFWNQYSDTICPIVNGSGAGGSRGVSADDDWEFNAQITIPNIFRRAIAACDTTYQPAGYVDGSATSTALLEHTHGVNDPQHSHPYNSPKNPSSEGVEGSNGATAKNYDPNAYTGNASTGITIQSAGSGSSFSIMQPTIYIPVFIKL